MCVICFCVCFTHLILVSCDICRASLQNLLQQKDDAALKTRQLLGQAHQDAFKNREKHAQELQAMAERVNRLEAVSERVKDKPPVIERTNEDLQRVDQMVEEIAILKATLAEREA